MSAPSKNDSSKRDHESDDATNKRQKKNSPADDLICPISLELPWEPVTAEDGRVYDKEFIEKHIRHQRLSASGILKSPVTNLPMGARLVPLHQHKNLIQTLIDNGAISGDLVEAWNQKVKNKKFKDKWLGRANRGDAEAMYKVGVCHLAGSHGFNEDEKTAFTWIQKSHDAGNVGATAVLGAFFRQSCVVTPCLQQALLYTTMAAAQGEIRAVAALGLMLADGIGVPKNQKEAIKWLQKALRTDGQYELDSERTSQVQTKLNELLSS